MVISMSDPEENELNKFPWSLPLPEEMMSELGEVEDRMIEDVSKFADRVENSLLEAESTIFEASSTASNIMASIIRRNTGCSEVESFETLEEIYPWISISNDLDQGYKHFKQIDRMQLGMGVEKNAQLVSYYVSGAVDFMQGLLAIESMMMFEDKHGITLEEYLEFCRFMMP